MASSDTEQRYDFNFESVPEAPDELESAHPEIFEELQFGEESRRDEQTSFPNMSLTKILQTTH